MQNALDSQIPLAFYTLYHMPAKTFPGTGYEAMRTQSGLCKSHAEKRNVL